MLGDSTLSVSRCLEMHALDAGCLASVPSIWKYPDGVCAVRRRPALIRRKGPVSHRDSHVPNLVDAARH